MDMLRGIEIFMAVAEARSFAVAARKLGLSRAAVSVQIARLEERLGAQLLSRRGRAIVPTEAGTEFLRDTAPLLDRLDAILGGLAQDTQGMAGRIRIGVPPVVAARVVAPAVASFLAANPGIQVSLIHDDGRSNLTGEGLDISIRLVHALESTSETSLLLGRAPQRIVAAPAYLARHPPPVDPGDLRHHNCLTPDLGTPTHLWRFAGPEGEVAVHVTGSMKANMAEAVRAAALLGHGVILQPGFLLDGYIAAGELVPILPGYTPLPLTVYAVYGAPPRLLPRRIRAFLDFLKRWDGVRDVLDPDSIVLAQAAETAPESASP